MFGDGRKLMDEVYDSFNVVAFPAGQTGGQMFGWFRKEIKSPKDFEGLKMRTAGFGGCMGPTDDCDFVRGAGSRGVYQLAENEWRLQDQRGRELAERL